MELKCDKRFSSTPENCGLKAHGKVHSSNIGPRFCNFPGCDFRTKHQKSLKDHERRHEKRLELRKPYPCTFDGCEYRAGQSGALKYHVKAAHTPTRPRNFQCPLCPCSFHEKSHLLAHIPGHTKEKYYKCPFCNYKTSHESTLLVHVKRRHEKSEKCNCDFPGCNYSAKLRASLVVHRQTHNRDPLLRRPFACRFQECNYRATTNYVLTKHCRSRHNSGRSRDFPCPLCPKVFFSSGELTSHVTCRHTLEKHFRCQKCAYATTCQSNLRRHCRRMHEKTEPSEKTFKCEFCKYCTDRKSQLDQHVKAVHRDPIDFQCGQSGCSYKTNESSKFKLHLQTHETDPEKGFPLHCTVAGCDFRRRYRSEMKSHERRHEMAHIQLECDLCPRKYPDGLSWSFHRRLVHDAESFKCPFCEYSTCFGDNFARHVSNKHDPFSRNLKGGQRVLLRAGLEGGSKVICRKNNYKTSPRGLIEVGHHFGPTSATLAKVPVVILERIRLEII